MQRYIIIRVYLVVMSSPTARLGSGETEGQVTCRAMKSPETRTRVLESALCTSTIIAKPREFAELQLSTESSDLRSCSSAVGPNHLAAQMAARCRERPDCCQQWPAVLPRDRPPLWRRCLGPPSPAGSVPCTPWRAGRSPSPPRSAGPRPPGTPEGDARCPRRTREGRGSARLVRLKERGRRHHSSLLAVDVVPRGQRTST